ncbi:MAG: HlyD family efflux transporter periplasmic adaptor subunit [Rhodospirillales bacterium]|nr:HlyD family efflux transporter periplasmic adaptor subunit [Rhodospirillales bacterium]
MTAGDSDIFRALLEDLSDGVMVVGFDGTVRVANAAVCRMFGLDPAETVGCRFGEVFVATEGFDEFTEAVFDAVIFKGDIERRLASVRVDGAVRSLSVSTSYLTAESRGAGEAERLAVIVAISDITEIKELRETELRQAQTIKKQFSKLQTAYRDLESRNEALSSLTKRVRLARGGAMVLVLGVFVVIGAWYVRPLDLFSAPPALDAGFLAAAGGPGVLPSLTVEPRPFRSTVALRGRLAPGRVAGVVSPVDSHVSAVHVSAGQRVAAGDPLVEFDTGQLASDHRQAEIEYIRARDRLAELETWETGVEMSRALRALRQANLALGDAERALTRTAFLLERGIVPASEHEQAERSRENRQLDVEAAEQELEAVKAKGGEEALRAARLEAETAGDRLRAHEEKLSRTSISAPFAGIVMIADDSGDKPLARGRPVALGELLLSIADFERLAAEASVDEADVRKVTTGQRAWITGPGFPGLTVEGAVAQISAQAGQASGRRSAPQFRIVIALDRLQAATRDRLRVGMSAYVTIVVHDRPAALLVPIGAVEQSGGEAWVHVIDPGSTAVERRAVELGLTTLDSVEVVKGLAAGEEVVLPLDAPASGGTPETGILLR